MVQYKLTPEVEAELETVIAYSHEKWGIDRADQTMSVFENCFTNLALFPQSGQSIPDRNKIYQKPVIRMPYWVVYQLQPDQEVVTIIQIIHSRRNR
jgi:plasmid stabilization system protein ParE